MLNKEKIASLSSKRAHEDIIVPEWGETVRIMEMTGAQRSVYFSRLMDLPEKVSISYVNSLVVALHLVDESGDPLIATIDEGIETVQGFSGLVVARLADACRKISKIEAVEPDSEEEEPVETAEKNSAGTPSDSTSSA